MTQWIVQWIVQWDRAMGSCNKTIGDQHRVTSTDPANTDKASPTASPAGAVEPSGSADELLNTSEPVEPIIATLVQRTAKPSGNNLPAVVSDGERDDQADLADPGKKKGVLRRLTGWIAWLIRGIFCLVSLTVLLAVLTALPILQLIAFGYLLSVSGGLAQGAKLRDSLPHLREAGQIGLAAIAVFLAALPTQAIAHLESVATLIDPGSQQSGLMRVLAFTTSILMTLYLLWAWIRGGRLIHYLWPQPIRILKEGWRWSVWRTAPDRLWEFTMSLEFPKYFWLGLRGAIGTLVWLSPAFVIIAAFRNGETGLAGLVGFAALILLGLGMLYLPMLQVHFAAENRMAALFEVRTIRRDFRRAPWSWFAAMVISLVITPIPLYLLKIEATPREVMWAPCLVFVAFILPARMATGLALRRARKRPEPVRLWGLVRHGSAGLNPAGPTPDNLGKWAVAALSRNMIRLIMPLVVGVYLLFVYVSQYISWDGLLTWVQQHAILIPVPFLSGV